VDDACFESVTWTSISIPTVFPAAIDAVRAALKRADSEVYQSLRDLGFLERFSVDARKRELTERELAD
jgi:hypothetical protein